MGGTVLAGSIYMTRSVIDTHIGVYMTGKRLTFFTNGIIVRWCNRGCRGRHGHNGPDKANQPRRVKPPWKE